ncbi:hypothetical protein VOLCADRAFT_106243 [Volvox carteri f. nagariensis]|uniref:ACT domain-containing protein n=1 Tax=Volvox carteri f. nagariensis TaxID=3068 RepID=D8U630_VOLCA|nr:uncharacterized protein VOLCADRAFT_106243 [Volvox carteri f. nagariensis]EFJ44867.1 hypothetical protein VOLCADRAFT_106243 [Volvox carteri f. nagariensis]|eukprot:XP_002954150.1 hypothetical protein VOLCADRAFT_106243 [Volvox carteri f. nagariensis]
MGWAAVSKGLDATVHDDAAVPLFDKAKDSFRDVACTGLASWGQTHQLLGQRMLEAAARAGKDLEGVRSGVLSEFSEAERRYREALGYNPDFFDAVCNMSQLEFERCKLAAGLMAAPPTAAPEKAEQEQPNSGADGEAAAAAAAAPSADGAAATAAASSSSTTTAAEGTAADAANAATRAALSVLKAEAVAGARGGFEKALEWAEKAVALAPAMDARQKEAQAKAAEAGQPQAPPQQPGQQEYDFRSQALVLKGNFIYEWSQMLAAVGHAEEWRSELDRAVALFREAGCPEKDIRVALRNHFKADELDIPAEEPAKEEEGEATATPAAKPEAAPVNAPGSLNNGGAPSTSAHPTVSVDASSPSSSLTANLLLQCPDQKGVIAAVSQLLYGFGCNIVASDQFSDPSSSMFFQRITFDFSDIVIGPGNTSVLERAIAELALRYTMKWQISYKDKIKRLAILVSKQIADTFGVRFHHLPLNKDPGIKEAQETAIEDLLVSERVDVMILARYMQIFSSAFCQRHWQHTINIHHSFLPAFEGARPYHRAHERGVKIIGATAHFATAELDAGPIIDQAVTRITHRDSVEDMIRKGRDLERMVLARAVRWHLDDRVLVYNNKTVVFED